MKRTHPQRIDEIIDRTLNDNNISTAFNEQKVCYLWQEVVGATINRYTTRRYVQSGTLHVYISSAPLKGELQFHRRRLVDALNKVAGVEVINNILIH